MQSNDEAAEPLKIPGITYHEINFNGSAFSRYLVSKLSWYNFGRLITLMALGYRLEAISILGVNVMSDRGVIGLGIDSIDVCTHEVFQVFQVLVEPSNYPVMIHCTQGKDRTGLTVMLCLALLGVPVDAIDYDYMLSQDELEPEKEERLKEIRSIGMGDEFANCDPKLITKLTEHIKDRYGGVEQYLLDAGVTAEMQESVKRILGRQ
jgi:protein-tyrosine phosphatase